MITFILIVIVIGILILGHEWGHFFAARRLGVKVEEFGLGFPPRIFSRMKNGVRYSFNALPFGGFVKIFGEHGEGAGDRASFVSRPVWQRFIILAAGVGMNLVLAWVFFSVAAGIGVPRVGDESDTATPVSILEVVPGSPAEHAGLKFGDEILQMRTPAVSLRIETEKDVQDFTDAYRGEEIIMTVRRQADVREIQATPRITSPDGEGPLGIVLGRIVISRAPWYLAPVEGFRSLWMSVVGTLEGLGQIVRDLVVKHGAGVAVSGPIGIFLFAADSRALGAAYFLQFVGVISVNLAILNILPIPALDGGRVLFLVIEKVRGRRVAARTEDRTHAIGFIVLILLMALVTWHDIVHLL